MLEKSHLLTRLRLIRPPSAVPPSPALILLHHRGSGPLRFRLCCRCHEHRSLVSTSTSTARPAPWPAGQEIPLGEYYESILRKASDDAYAQRHRHPPRPLDDPLVLDVPLSDPRAADEKTRTPLDKTSSFDTSPPAPPPPPAAAASTSSSSSAAASATIAAATVAAEPPKGAAVAAATAQDKIRIVFGSRLLGPAELEDRAAARREQSTLIAGVLVPPRPEEPDNCCMSGCVNCVWDRYGEELEEWTARKSEAEDLLRATGAGPEGEAGGERELEGGKKAMMTKEMLEEEAYSDVPMAIREFIKMEKRLRVKHEQERAMHE